MKTLPDIVKGLVLVSGTYGLIATGAFFCNTIVPQMVNSVLNAIPPFTLYY